MKKIFFIIISLLATLHISANVKRSHVNRPRVFILTDISTLDASVGEPDDTESLIRFLLYANEFGIEGFGATYTSSGKTIYPQYIKQVITLYGESLPRLRKHGHYPSSKSLLKKVKSGMPQKGLSHMGKEKDTELSNYLVKLLTDSDTRPLWVLAWGGTIDLAQALWKIQTGMSQNALRRAIAKLRVYAIADQYDDAGLWIRQNFKDLFYILNNGSFRGMYRTGNVNLVSSDWVTDYIHSSSASLARLYPNYKGGDPWGRVVGIKEGDTPSFLYLLPQSHNVPEKPEIEGWGGCFQRIEGTNHFVDGVEADALSLAPQIAKWRTEFQQDFAIRIGWLNDSSD